MNVKSKPAKKEVELIFFFFKKSKFLFAILIVDNIFPFWFEYEMITHLVLKSLIMVSLFKML